MKPSMTKDMLKSGYIVQLKSGELRMVLRAGSFTHVLVSEDGSWTYLSRWNDDLTRNLRSCLDQRYNGSGETVPGAHNDIVKVYGLVQGVKNYHNVLKITTEGRELLWDRNPRRRMTLEEIERVLGYPVEIVTSQFH